MIEQNQLETILESINLQEQPPVTEPQRQYYFLKKLREIVKEKSAEAGDSLE